MKPFDLKPEYYFFPIKSHIEPSKDFDSNIIITDDLCDTVFVPSLPSGSMGRVVLYGIRKALENKYKVIRLENIKDIWMREYMPVQITADKFWYFEFNPDSRQSKSWKNHITDYRMIKDISSVIPNRFFNSLTVPSKISADGSNIVKCDGYIIMTDKVFVEKTNVREDITWIDLYKEMGVDIVVIPRDPVDYNGHADEIVRYAGPNRVIFRAVRDAEDRKFMDGVITRFKQQKPSVIVEQFNFDKVKNPSKYNGCYINFLRVGNIIILPLLSHYDLVRRSEVWREIEEDEIALNKMHDLFPQCEIFGLDIFGFLEETNCGGGILNRLTWSIKSII